MGRRPLRIVSALVAGLAVLAPDDRGSPAAAAEPDWPYETGFRSYLLHVHPEVNYALSPEWLAAWERDRLGPGAFRGVFGSSATDELLVDAQWSLNPVLGAGLRFRNDIVWQERRHLPFDRRDIWLGLEQRVWRSLGAVVEVVPAEAKETIDLRLGALWTSADRTRYLQLVYVLEDLVYDEKNDLGGETRTAPRGLDWLLRLARGPWSLYSRGHWVRAFDREYPDPERSPDLAAHRRAANELEVRARWQPASRALVELAWQQSEDAEGRSYPGEDDRYDHDYAGWYRLVSARGLVPVAPRWRLRAELHGLRRRAAASGWNAFVYHRTETMPALWAEWSWGGRHRLRAGYLGTFYRWQYAGEAAASGFADKVELACAFGLRDGAALELSLSHEVSLERFGGASVRMVARF